jgi:hypothetical protein
MAETLSRELVRSGDVRRELADHEVGETWLALITRWTFPPDPARSRDDLFFFF